MNGLPLFTFAIKPIILIIIMLYIECHYTDYHCAECHYADNHYAACHYTDYHEANWHHID
jgi:hypothetical protein